MDWLGEIITHVKRSFIPEEKAGERERFESAISQGKAPPKERIQGGALVLDPSSFFNPKSLVQGKVLETVENLAKGRFKFSGNWGGPSYSAGRFFDKDEYITMDDIIKNPPTDALDELTLKHDLRYTLAATRDARDARKKGLRLADEDFIREAEQLLKSQDLPFTLRAKTQAAILAFKGKLASDLGYNIDQLPNSTQAKQVVMDYFNQVDPAELSYQDRIPQAPESFLTSQDDDEAEEIGSISSDITDDEAQLDQEVLPESDTLGTQQAATDLLAIANDTDLSDAQLALAAMQLLFPNQHNSDK